MEGKIISQLSDEENKKILTEKVDQTDSNEDKDTTLTAAQRARAERNRQRALALKEARLIQRPHDESQAAGARHVAASRAGARHVDTGGGFLLEEDEAQAAERSARPRAPPAPVVHRAEQPHCLLCERPFPQSYLFDTFDYSVCDACRDDEGAHCLITRTEAKSEFLLKDCDLDLRPPPLRCVRRRNPHRARFAEMRLYLRAQVQQRALAVWGSEEALRRERGERAARRERAAGSAARRRLRALRMDVRSSLFDRTRAPHEHAFGPEAYDEAEDVYRRSCACGHVETYEKM
ncbi:unnamed protein product [Euphydryas editha]|uniref:XPA C-terminal domain-containing protein n=1 Tax=Euphydryas editha TaxID=104508 RepID=A0AAU9UYK7_EUPED|nr:unnamed protein product [Euphydryas editha]